MEWIRDHWAELAALASAVHVLAAIIVNLTPTPKDDIFVGKVYRLIETAAFLITKEARGVKQ